MQRELESLRAAGMAVRELGPREFLVPGFIDTHIHFPQFPFAGTGIDRPLMAEDGFLKKYAFPIEQTMQDRQRAEHTYRMALDQILGLGTTTALVYGSAHLEASKVLVDVALQRGGPRCCVGKTAMDRNCSDGYVETLEASLSHTEAFMQYTQARAKEGDGRSPYLVQPVVTPRFLPTCTPELLRGLGKLAEKYGAMIQSHMSESCDEVAFSRALFPEHPSDAHVFASYGLLRAPAVMGHCVHLMPGEEELLRRHGAAIAHCPLSNFFFAKETLPVKELVLRGVKVGLGTDVAGGYSPSMLVAMRTAVLASKTLQFRRAPGCAFNVVPPGSAEPKGDIGSITQEEDVLRDRHDLSHFDALYLATLGGAEALGMENDIGSFESGKAFDAVLLSADESVRAVVLEFPDGTAETPEDVLQKILTNGDDRNVRAVYVDGRCVCGS